MKQTVSERYTTMVSRGLAHSAYLRVNANITEKSAKILRYIIYANSLQMPSSTPDNPTGSYYAYVPDYQGNIVAVINTSNNDVEQTNDYYPYGLQHVQPEKESLPPIILLGEDAAATNGEIVPPIIIPGTEAILSNDNRYKFGGKEFVTNHGWDAYDFAARWHTPAFPRFTTQDPKATDYHPLSPYLFCATNPVNFIDPNGEDVYSLNEVGEFTLIERNLDNEDIIYIEDNKEITFKVPKTFFKDTESHYGHDEKYPDSHYETIFYNYTGFDEGIIDIIVSNTNVEYSFIKYSSLKGNGIYIGTSHQYDRDSNQPFMVEKCVRLNQTIIQAIHNHTNSTSYVSSGDVEMAKYITGIFPNTTFFVIVKDTLKRKEFDQFSTPGEFPEVVVYGKK